MSRQRMPLEDGRLLVIGWDESFQTWFALLYDDHDEDAPPAVAIGYTPDEQALLRAERPGAVIGSYPVEDLEAMLSVMIPELAGLDPEPSQPMCGVCGEPPWRSNVGCRMHPYNRLRG